MESLAANLKQKADQICSDEALTLFEVFPDFNGQYVPLEKLAKYLSSPSMLLSSKI